MLKYFFIFQSYMFLVRLDPILVIYLNSMQRIGKTIVELNPTPLGIDSVYGLMIIMELNMHLHLDA